MSDRLLDCLATGERVNRFDRVAECGPLQHTNKCLELTNLR